MPTSDLELTSLSLCFFRFLERESIGENHKCHFESESNTISLSLSRAWFFLREIEKGKEQKISKIPVGIQNRKAAAAAARFQRMCFAATVVFGACASDSLPIVNCGLW
ncbi:hypothetical protein ABKV19_022580 [Rosa sericea]